MIRALIFDFDGLMVDTETSEFLAWREQYREQGQELEAADWIRAVGYVGGFDPRAELESRLGRALDWTELDSRRRRRHHELIPDRPLPGVRALVEAARARGLGLAVASNSSRDWVEQGLARVGLREAFRIIRGRDDFRRPKPDPEVYLAALQALGAEARECLALEDSEPGVRAAKAAGLKVVAVPSWLTKMQDLSLADEVRESLEGFTLPETGREGMALGKGGGR